MNDKGTSEDSKSITGKRSDLSRFFLDPIKDGLESGLAKATVDPGRFVLLISLAEPLRAVVECISEGFMDTLQSITASHKDLASSQNNPRERWRRRRSYTLSKAVEHARGWVATKIGLVDMFHTKS
jgi:hypothetical protein